MTLISDFLDKAYELDSESIVSKATFGTITDFSRLQMLLYKGQTN